MKTNELELDSVRKSVRGHYGSVATRGSSPMLDAVMKSLRGRLGKGAARGSGCGCGPASGSPGAPGQPGNAALAALTVGYSAAEVQNVPDGANLGLGCGNPLADRPLLCAQLEKSEPLSARAGGFDAAQKGT